MQNTRNILLLGSGLMAESVAKHILSRPEVNLVSNKESHTCR